VLQPGSSATSDACGRRANCTVAPMGRAGAEPELEADAVRTAWLVAVKAFAARVADDFSPTTPQARVRPEG
jgi:hypothetical protein